MNVNANSHFMTTPSVDVRRTKMTIPNSHKFTANVGEVIPFYMDQDVLPGDTYSIDTSLVARLQTMITPMMDNLYLDIYYFFVPHRLVWSHWKEFMGENTESAWIPQTEYTIPQLTSPVSTGWSIGTIADHFGIPTGLPGISVSALPFRAYALVMNEWFRSTVVTDPLNITMSDATQAGVNTGNYITDTELGGLPFVAKKYYDLFTSCTPSPQRGPDVMLPVGQSKYPVYALDEEIPSDWDYYAVGRYGSASAWTNSYFGGNVAGRGDNTWPAAESSFADLITDNKLAQGTSKIANSNSDNYNYRSELVNLWAVADPNTTASATINQLRTAFAIQRFYEREALAGDRYTELIAAHFGVRSPDSRLQRPEFLAARRVPININQVIQTSATDQSEFLGDVSALSVTADSSSNFTHSFTEHGTLLGVCVMRYKHSYQQGIPRGFSRKSRFDFYWPLFQSLGNMAVYNKEIYAQGSSVVDANGDPYDEQVFGYQEAWYSYRMKPDFYSGEMRSQAATSLDVWHLGDDYSSLPTLSDDWIREDKTNVDRVLTVTSSVANQYFADFYIKNNATRCMPLYSLPGLIDHH